MLMNLQQLAYMTVELIVGIALGFVPYVDNFGGFEVCCSEV